jgi:hypothetical protein
MEQALLLRVYIMEQLAKIRRSPSIFGTDQRHTTCAVLLYYFVDGHNIITLHLFFPHHIVHERTKLQYQDGYPSTP